MHVCIGGSVVTQEIQICLSPGAQLTLRPRIGIKLGKQGPSIVGTYLQSIEHLYERRLLQGDLPLIV